MAFCITIPVMKKEGGDDGVKLVAPDYYKEFHCIADQCRHSCCIGWEIDIDEESMAYYRTAAGDIGEKLRANIDESGEGACFRLTEDERCPFLTEKGLCELILEIGEDALCQICDDHPRFRSFFADHTEIGLGLCCEAAGRLILGRTEKTALAVLEDDGEDDAPDEYEQEIIDLRERLTEIAQDRRAPVRERAQNLLAAGGVCLKEIDFPEWADFLEALERLDDSWAERLEDLKKEEGEKAGEQWDTALEQLLVYLLYRHLPGAAEDGDVQARVGYVYVMWRLVERMFCAAEEKSLEELIEISRLYSSEIEYSDENGWEILEKIHGMMR